LRASFIASQLFSKTLKKDFKGILTPSIMQNLLTFPEYLKFNLWVTQAEIITALSINKQGYSSWWLNSYFLKPRG